MSALALPLAFGIGIAAGVRCFIATAIVSFAAHAGWLDLRGTPLAFVGSTWVLVLLTVGALAEIVVDKLPKIPPRTSPGPLLVRTVLGALCGACVAAHVLWAGALLGAIGALLGTAAGYQSRMRLARALRVPDAPVAIAEDLIAIGLAFFFVSRFVTALS